MAVNWPRVPALDSPDALDGPLPESWRLDKIENLYELLPIGKRFDQKSSSPQGRVPVIDQSEAGVIGWHNEEPGVKASESRPVVTFANHTCEMRWMQQSFSVIQNVFPLIGRSGVCDTRFLYYGTKGRVHLEEYKGHFPDYRRKWIPVPPIPEQRAIAHILGTLDDKIELNRRMSATLEAMARALFKSWFVDFDPVRAKMEGRDPGLPQALADLFPARLVDSELGEIPEGWEVKKLGELLELAYGKALKAEDRRDGNIPVYGSNGQVGWHDERLAQGPGIVVGRKGNPGIATWVPTDFFPIDTTFYVVPRSNCRSLAFLFHALRTHDLASLGADSAVPGLNRNLAYMSSQVLPAAPLLVEFDRIASALSRRSSLAIDDSRNVAALRDALLPKLISGELRVPDAEAFLKARGP